jgi:hypothetical protein
MREPPSRSRKRTIRKMPQSEERSVIPVYEPTPQERLALQANAARRAKKPPAPRIAVKHADTTDGIRLEHADVVVGFDLLKEALGTADKDFLAGVLGQLVTATTDGGKVDERGLNFMLAIVKDVAPKDQLETLLAAQMAAVHMATMTFAKRLGSAENLLQQDSAERAFNKLARTFAGQLEALKRYRTGGEQRLTVTHVTVNEGGQAIVGSVQTEGGCPRQKVEEQPYAVNYSPGIEMPSPHTKREAVSVPRNGEWPLQDARRPLAGSAKRK